MELSYREARRLWKRYQSEGAAGLVRRSAGRSSNRAQPKKVRRKVLRLIREKYSGEVGVRFGPTLAAEHLASEDQIELSASTVKRGCWQRAAALERPGASAQERAKRALRRTGADGRQLP